MQRKYLSALILLLLVPAVLFAGTTGKISGRVVDTETGDPLAGANVIIIGTSFGAATDMNGYFFIINIPPGRYDVRAQFIGYQPFVITGVQVIVDANIKVDFDLSSTAILGEAVEIVAERPLLNVDMTGMTSVASSEEIESMPVYQYQDIMVLNPGFVESGANAYDREIHVRGGRDGEMAYMIDGFYVESSIDGGMGSNVTTVGITEMAMMTGAFNAEYGEAMSGVINIVTKEGGSDYEGRVRFRTDKYVNYHEYESVDKFLLDGKDWVTADGDRVGDVGTADVVTGQNKYDPDYWFPVTNKVNDFDTYRLDFNLGGPVPFFGDAVTFFASGEWYDSDTFLGYSGIPFDTRVLFNGKLVIKPARSLKMVIGGVYGDEEWREYNHSYKYTPDGLETQFRDNYMINFTLTHTLSPRTFYTIKASRFKTNYRRHLRDWTEKDFFSYQDENGEWQIKNPDGSYTGSALNPVPDEEYEFNKGYWAYSEDAQGNVVDSTWTIGRGDDWADQDNVTTTFKFDITSQMTRVHQVKMGVEGKLLELNNLEVYNPFVPKPDVTKYEHTPMEGSAYLQDKMEFENWNLVVTAGLRLDYMDADAQYFENPQDPTQSAVVNAEKKLHLSPRLSIAHPVTDKAVLHFSYGHFFQVPDYQYLYYAENEDYLLYPYPDMSINGIYSQIGNANLKPKQTVTYEVGLETKLAENFALDITAYYKDIYNYTALFRYMATPSMYHRFVNVDYANTKGVEVTLRKRFSASWGGQIHYVYSRAEGNQPDPFGGYDDWYSFSVYNTYPAKKTVTMDWDQTHTINFVLDFRKARNWSLNITGSYGSGLPYTPLSSRGVRLDELNSARQPWTMNVDLRATKMFSWIGLDYTFYLEVHNILNKRNVLNVYGSTGKPDATVDWDDTVDFLTRPHYFSEPRTLELGLAIGF